jgi:low temperature requirement protein LtrA
LEEEICPSYFIVVVVVFFFFFFLNSSNKFFKEKKKVLKLFLLSRMIREVMLSVLLKRKNEKHKIELNATQH